MSCDHYMYHVTESLPIDTDYTTAKVLLITFVVNNHVDEDKNGLAEAWEKAFLDYLKNYQSKLIEVSFIAEVGVVGWVWF